MIVFERFFRGTRFVPRKAVCSAEYAVAAPDSADEETRPTKSLIMIHSDEELLYYLQRGYSVRMVSEDGANEHLTKAEDVAVRFVPPYR
ncbi:hypothetical protein [Microvirga sp. CF3016]|uniref:hypothetical protein n=1 Tax=Microvirga sp. CF3016 TaxID=3110181 RepID=UPI002E797C47|nr:hypothetical protein [Microvirga sp. CF3016]MEE1609819.1 hypothetical protein [Microvirga sp. CF3016]